MLFIIYITTDCVCPIETYLYNSGNMYNSLTVIILRWKELSRKNRVSELRKFVTQIAIELNENRIRSQQFDVEISTTKICSVVYN